MNLFYQKWICLLAVKALQPVNRIIQALKRLIYEIKEAYNLSTDRQVDFRIYNISLNINNIGILNVFKCTERHQVFTDLINRDYYFELV